MTSSSLLAHPFAVVDVETTGASAVYDRVIEVAVVRLEGGEIVDRFETLVDPRAPIPPFITRLTGIEKRMLRGRPTFADVARRVDDALGSGPLVGHNVAFDEAFLRHAFTRVGVKLDLPPVCTLRLARRLLPRLRSYRLDALLAHLGIKSGGRHRAGPDAVATAQLLLRLLELASEQGLDELDQLVRLQSRRVTRHARGVDEGVLAALPSGPGVYLLKDRDGHVLYIGKSVRVRHRVREHLRGDGDQPRLRRRLHAIVDVEAVETGSELEALFLESRLIKRYLPEANVLQRNAVDYPFIRIDVDDPYPTLVVTREPPRDGALHFGPFRRRTTADGAADFLRERLKLRDCDEPIGSVRSACARLDLGKCLGPCVGAVDQITYRAAAQRAADVLRGRDGTLLAELVARRDELAEQLRFEEAAALRDRIRQLEHVVGAQRRLDAVSERNLIVVAPSTRRDGRELFCIRAGRLVLQVGVGRLTRPSRLTRVLRGAFESEPPEPVTREVVDEMHLLDGWLRRHTERLTLVPIDPADPLAALDAVVAALRQRPAASSMHSASGRRIG
jgi:DNA polymerase-3 subunit epsilon